MIELVIIPGGEWRKEFLESAHKLAFNTEIDAETERVDFGILALKDNVPGGYMTCRELGRKALYLQFGGVFPHEKQGFYVFQGYKMMLNWCLERYKTLETYIENTNTPMLKMAMKAGFLITGTKLISERLLLHHVLEVKDAV